MSKYIKEDVEIMLRNHKKNEAKLTEVQLKKEGYQEQLCYAGTVYEDTENEIIENMQVAGQAYDSIHSNTNKISDKVSNTVANYKNELNHINKFDRQYINSKIIECEAEENILNKKMQDEISKLNFEKAKDINNDIVLLKSLSHKQDIINNANENKPILAWINLDDENIKIYVIKGAKLLKSELIKVEDFELDNLIYTIKEQKKIFIMREENIRKKLYSTSAVKKEGSKVGSSYCCYGVELI